MTIVALRQKVTTAEENKGPVQYRQHTLRRLRIVLTNARSRLSAAQQRYKGDFNRKVSFRGVIITWDVLYVDRLPRALTKAERQNSERPQESTTNASCKPLPKFKALLPALGYR